MSEFWHPELRRVLNQINAQYGAINEKLEKIAMSQSDVDAATAALTGAATTLTTVAADLTAAQANVATEIAALKAANPAVDTTALDAAVAGLSAPLAALQAADTAVDSLETPATPPAGG